MWYFGFVFAITIAILLVRYYAEKRTGFYICSLVAFSWALGFSFFLVLPFDIEHAFCRACLAAARSASAAEQCGCLPQEGIEAMTAIIPILYVLTMLMGYLMNDLIREYLMSGEFTRRGRMKDALREASYFYVPALVIGISVLLFLMLHDGLSFLAVKSIGRGFVNTIGLFILIGFLGYGFVEVPRNLWNHGNIEGQSKYLKFRVAVQSEALQNARRKLEETLEIVRSTEVQLRPEKSGSPLHEHMAKIIRRCPRSTRTGASARDAATPMRPICEPSPASPSAPTLDSIERAATDAPAAPAAHGGIGGSSDSGGGKLLPTTRKGLVALHLRLKRAVHNEKRARSMYELFVRQALRQMARFEPAAGGGAASSATVVGGRWHGALKPLLCRALSVVCAVRRRPL